ncbi:thermonuclease family protein [Aminobacter aganoensis]|uniref:Endonuclease YncB(Thermonuclease family) n=1 Tax=Aminobacter aganoensis TaxID=83264 RepID=A0A7X0KP39_9HYPH|nr:thermonuclease family protein [Aminobacter aganoensis]MBB6357810.1 endonuclease YncB(thermonuclease family) [Aminobacter aganoensis]
MAIVGGIFAYQAVERSGGQFGRMLDSLGPSTPRTAPGTIQGRASVIDGDTIEVAGQRVRFNGIDAPESSQYCQDATGFDYACGRTAARALDQFLAASRPVKCAFVEWDQYDRFVGNCFRADGKSVAGWLVENGHALDWPRYSKLEYGGQQSAAKDAKRGIWQGQFQKPWDWRADHTEDVAPTSVAPSPSFALLGSSSCDIKGNVSAEGERIYHVPGQKFYRQTKISERKGERWFCSEAEAKQAGWRKAKR